MTRRVDVAILGGGCAGLSLAATLAHHAPSISAIVLERRRAYRDDRTWCGWPTQPHGFSNIVRRSWPRWRVTTDAAAHDIAAETMPYESIASTDFYDAARAIVDAAPNVTLQTGIDVVRVEQRADAAIVATADGDDVEARWVIDTIPKPRALSYPWLWQSFVGFEIQAAGAGGDDVPMLMDFRVPQSDGVSFLYMIPYAPDVALFELTRFTAALADVAQLEAQLRVLLTDRFPRGYEIIRREQADLPMAPSEARVVGRIIPAGVTGGAMRPATGYAFHAIQRWAQQCAARLAGGETPVVPPLGSALVWMDRLFMSIVRDDPAGAPALYARLFAGTKPDALVRFLAGMPTPADTARVVNALPWGTFLRAAFAQGARA